MQTLAQLRSNSYRKLPVFRFEGRITAGLVTPSCLRAAVIGALKRNFDGETVGPSAASSFSRQTKGAAQEVSFGEQALCSQASHLRFRTEVAAIISDFLAKRGK
ncbi:hypothetical protein NKH63_28690 [Mesorhizobium sp. M0960]|uniref:hypothetical protein n=1 Tax=Mesorhizobium sp. M0960 TaxID=2957035 RepID=UPI0033362E42